MAKSPLLCKASWTYRTLISNAFMFFAEMTLVRSKIVIRDVTNLTSRLSVFIGFAVCTILLEGLKGWNGDELGSVNHCLNGQCLRLRRIARILFVDLREIHFCMSWGSPCKALRRLRLIVYLLNMSNRYRSRRHHHWQITKSVLWRLKRHMMMYIRRLSFV